VKNFTKSLSLVTTRNLYTVVSHHDGVLLLLDSLYRLRERRSAPVDGSNLDAHHDHE